MSKERWGFDVEREMKRLKNIVNKDDSLTISCRFVKYLIEQSERAQELENIEYALQESYRQEQQYALKLEGLNKRHREAIDYVMTAEATQYRSLENALEDIKFVINETLESDLDE